MSLEDWQALGVVCGSLIAVLTLLGLAARGLRRMWRAAWRTIRRLNEVADDLLGDEQKGIPSMTDRVQMLDRRLAEHLEWHASPGGQPARPVAGRPNGGTPGRR